MHGLYTLDRNGNPQIATTVGEWTACQREQVWHLAYAEANGFKVSTIFTGINFNFGLTQGPPLVFETVLMSMRGDIVTQWRSSTREQAMKHHRAAYHSVA